MKSIGSTLLRTAFQVRLFGAHSGQLGRSIWFHVSSPCRNSVVRIDTRTWNRQQAVGLHKAEHDQPKTSPLDLVPQAVQKLVFLLFSTLRNVNVAECQGTCCVTHGRTCKMSVYTARRFIFPLLRPATSSSVSLATMALPSNPMHSRHKFCLVSTV